MNETDHNYYIVPNLIDLAKVQDEARTRQAKGESSIVHHHTYNEPCVGKEHESYSV